MQQSTITIDTGKTVITSNESGETLNNGSLIVGKEYIVTIQLTMIK